MIPAGLSAILAQRMCAQDQVVQRHVLPLGDHAQAIGPAMNTALKWLEQRAERVPVVSDCPTG